MTLETQELVQKVVQGCASRGVSVSEVLAAFVARTVSDLYRGWRSFVFTDASLVRESFTVPAHRL